LSLNEKSFILRLLKRAAKQLYLRTVGRGMMELSLQRVVQRNGSKWKQENYE